jgi:D-amino-acid dehydrogenase
MPGDEFVLAGGAWSGQIARPLGLRLPMQAGKGYSLTLPHAPIRPRMGTILSEARVAITPIGDSLRIGGTMEMAGLDETINPVRIRGIQKAACRYYPDLSPQAFDDVQPWSGLRPCSPDGLPYLGRTQRYANLIIATGHAMLGLSLGPITGKLTADLLAGRRPDIDLTLLDPDRYCAGPRR